MTYVESLDVGGGRTCDDAAAPPPSPSASNHGGDVYGTCCARVGRGAGVPAGGDGQVLPGTRGMGGSM
jgi:hypothetical protein